jgi:hypothetical protein
MHSFVQKSITSVKTSNGRSKTKFSVTKGKDGVVHKLEGSRSSNNPDNLLVHESIRSLNNRTGKIHSANRVFKMKSSDIMNLLKESNTRKEPISKKVITAQKKITSTLKKNNKKISSSQIKLGKKKESLKKVDCLLLIIGYGSEKKKILDFINLNNLNKNVIILDKITNPYPYFKISDLFILTSLYEGFGNVLTEAIMFKIPTISTDCNSGPKEILLNGKGGDLVKVGDYKNLAKKIVINLNKKNYKKISLAYQGLKRFSIKKIIDQYNEIFKTI